jgi:site-specific recombinase XerD
MLTAYRRHSEKCPHKADGRSWKRCKCPLWTDGSLNGREMRVSLDKLGCYTWEQGQEKIREWESKGRIVQRVGTVPYQDAIDKFMASAKACNLATGTIINYNSFFRGLAGFCSDKGIRDISQLDMDLTEQFRNSWTCSPNTARTKLIYLRFFMKYCLKRKWIDENHAKELGSVKVKEVPTLPYNVEEVRLILDLIQQNRYEGRRNKPKQETIVRAQRLRLMCLVMRYSGLRVSDAITLSSNRLDSEGRLFLHMAKTGTPVYCVLPLFLVDQLQRCPMASMDRYFWDGTDDQLRKDQIGYFREMFIQLAGKRIPNVGFHRFRDTFAVELLLADVKIERVSQLLGHTSIETTEKHYAPWIAARQRQVEDDMRRVQANDPLIASETRPAKLARVK